MDRTFQATSAQNAFPKSEGSCGDLSEMEAQLLDGGTIGALLFRGQRGLGATALLHSLEQVPGESGRRLVFMPTWAVR